jgi:hypothetical protein
MPMFKNQAEFDSFRAWAIEGSCLAQRMNSGEGCREFIIPKYWHKYKEHAEHFPSILPDYLKEKL